MKRFAVGLGVMAMVAGCSNGLAEPEASPPPASSTATADVRNVLGQSKAQAVATQMGDSIRIRLEATGMPRGSYAAHVHSVGRCDPPDFTSAGPHWNPTGQQHGKNNPQGMHKGDLPNLLVGTDGRGSFEFTIPLAEISGGAQSLLDADGAALVVHAQPDDFRTDPSGNAGGRIACGIFRVG